MRYIVLCVFIVIIGVPLLGDISRIQSVSTLEENRNVASLPENSLLEEVAFYLKNFDNTFWGREYLVRAYISIKKDFFGVSPLPDKVVIGKEGWLFLADYGTMDDCRNIHPFTVSQLDSIESNLSKLNDSLGKVKIELYVIVVPDKHTIYPEYLPSNIRKVNPRSRLEQLSERLHANEKINFIDLTDTLRSSKGKGLLYYKEESHWNDLGAFIAYQKILRTCRKDFPQLEILDLNECRTEMGREYDIDLAKLLGQSIDYYEPSLRITPSPNDSIVFGDPKVNIPRAKRFNPNYACKKLNFSKSQYKAIIYRDSFFGALVPFFEQSFSESTYIWTNDVNINYVLSQDAQMVFVEIAERHIDLLAE